VESWHIALFVIVGVLAVAAFVSECALCRRERSSRPPETRARLE